MCLDKVFLDEQFVDPYYRARRENSIIITLACGEPLPTCFCTSVGTSPAGTEGADIIAHDIGDVLLLETATAKGEAFLKEHSGLFAKPKAPEKKASEQQAAQDETNTESFQICRFVSMNP